MKHLTDYAKVLVIVLRLWEDDKGSYIKGVWVGVLRCGDLSWNKTHQLHHERENQLKERKRPALGPLLMVRQVLIKKD